MEKVQDSSLSAAATNGFASQEQYEQEQHQQLRRAQRCLLQRKYDETISICTNYFQSFQQQHNHNNRLFALDQGSVIKLKCQIPRPYVEEDQLCFDIHVSCCSVEEDNAEPAMLDQMMVIALQAIEEKDVPILLQKKIWNRKPPPLTQLWNRLMESLDISSIGLEAFCVWMQFWQARGLWKEALRWNLSVLVNSSSNHNSSKQQIIQYGPTISPQEELWIECLTQQLPRIRDHRLAVELMGPLKRLLLKYQPKKTSAFQTEDWDTIEGDIQKCLLAIRMEDQPQLQTIRSIQDCWVHDNFGSDGDEAKTILSRMTSDQLFSSASSKAILDAWKANVETIALSDQAALESSEDYNSNVAEEDSLVPLRPQQNPKLWTTWIDNFVGLVHRKVQETIRVLAKNHQNPHFKSQVILSLTITILSWRQRKNLRVILSYILLPIRELLDALKAQ